MNLKYKMPITVNSGKVLVSDPSYEKNHEYSLTLDVKNGHWKAYVEEEELDGWGLRILRLVMVHTSIYLDDALNLEKNLIGKIAVDSGHAGIYDIDCFPEENWMEELDMKFEKNFECVKYGATAHSGLGDGSYSVYTAQKNNENVFIEIEFINEEILSKYKIK